MTKTIDQTAPAAGTADDVDTTTKDELDDDELEQSFEDDSWDDGDEDDSDDSDDDDPGAAATDEGEDDLEDSDDDVDTEDSDDSDEEDEPTEDQEDPDAAGTAAKDAKQPDAADGLTPNQRAAAYRVQQKLQRDAAKRKQQEDWIAQGKTESQRALRRLEVNDYNNQINSTTTTLREGVLSARQSIDLFRSKEPVVQEALLSAIDEFEAKYVEKDTNGDFVDIKIDPETGEKADVRIFLAKKAAGIRSLTGLGAKQQEQAKKSQKKRTATLPTRTPVKKKVDPMLEAFDEEAAS